VKLCPEINEAQRAFLTPQILKPGEDEPATLAEIRALYEWEEGYDQCPPEDVFSSDWPPELNWMKHFGAWPGRAEAEAAFAQNGTTPPPIAKPPQGVALPLSPSVGDRVGDSGPPFPIGTDVAVIQTEEPVEKGVEGSLAASQTEPAKAPVGARHASPAPTSSASSASSAVDVAEQLVVSAPDGRHNLAQDEAERNPGNTSSRSDLHGAQRPPAAAGLPQQTSASSVSSAVNSPEDGYPPQDIDQRLSLLLDTVRREREEAIAIARGGATTATYRRQLAELEAEKKQVPA
jgi:hypothetical protein